MSEITHINPDARQASEFPAVGKDWVAPGQTGANAMTCDVEDYFQVSAFENIISRDDWSSLECRIPQNIDRILELYDEAGVVGTFFILGWVAERFPEYIRRITDAGNEVASHGMVHSRVWDLSSAQFLADVGDSKKLIEDASGCAVRGFRAASWSFDQRTPWAHELLAEAGYDYSSSIYPVARDHYGIPDAPIAPFYIKGLELLEIPASSTRFFGKNWPAAGGGFFRLLPYTASAFLVKRVQRASGIPAIFYYHPWELDPEQPRIFDIGLKTRVRHYLNLSRFEARFARLLAQFEWGRMDEIFLGRTDVR